MKSEFQTLANFLVGQDDKSQNVVDVLGHTDLGNMNKQL